MSKIKNGWLDQYGADSLNPSNGSNLERLALKGLKKKEEKREHQTIRCGFRNS